MTRHPDLIYRLQAEREGDVRDLGEVSGPAMAAAMIDALEAAGTWPEGFDAVLWEGYRDADPDDASRSWAYVDGLGAPHPWEALHPGIDEDGPPWEAPDRDDVSPDMTPEASALWGHLWGAHAFIDESAHPDDEALYQDAGIAGLERLHAALHAQPGADHVSPYDEAAPRLPLHPGPGN